MCYNCGTNYYYKYPRRLNELFPPRLAIIGVCKRLNYSSKIPIDSGSAVILRIRVNSKEDNAGPIRAFLCRLFSVDSG